jgi:hypothetical protein
VKLGLSCQGKNTEDIMKTMLFRIFGPKMDEMVGDWRKLHNEELHNFYYSPIFNQIQGQRLISVVLAFSWNQPKPEVVCNVFASVFTVIGFISPDRFKLEILV